MVNTILRAKAEIAKREWVEFEMTLNEDGKVTHVNWHALGCHNLLSRAQELATQVQGAVLSQFSF